MWYTHTHTHKMEHYSAIKENEILSFATTWMDPEGNMLSEVSQRKHILLIHDFTICGI